MTTAADRTGIHHLSAAELSAYRSRHRESEYMLVDVRQPREYEEGHIAGAVLIPLPELERGFPELPPDRELIFYCRSGARSMAAAVLTREAHATTSVVHNLQGGILAWNDRLVPDSPRVAVFDEAGAGRDGLRKAMELEKGALRFYRAGAERFAGQRLSKRAAAMADAETAHARMVYRVWKAVENDLPSFETMFDSLSDSIIEGGEAVQTAVDRLETLPGPPCMQFIELALQIESAALDLYRNMAERADDEELKGALFSLAQAEKDHIRSLAEAVEDCPE
jgi:rhodanese-related sulfurtransferase/rubrerythrin